MMLSRDYATRTIRRLAALHEVALFRPEMKERICCAVDKIDLNVYKDSMSPLIKKDIEALMSEIN